MARRLTSFLFAAALWPVALQAQDQISVVATTGMIADAARVVGGEIVSVQALMGPGVDPHSYRQTRSDIVAAARADVVLWHGLYLEAQMEEFFEDLSRSRNVLAVAEGLPRDLLLAHEDYENRFDPHVWMVPDLWQHVARNVLAALIATDPDNADHFTANAEAFFAELETLSAYSKNFSSNSRRQSTS